MQSILGRRLLCPKLTPFFSSSTFQVGPTRLQSPLPEPPPTRSPLDEAQSRDVFLSNQIISGCVRSGDLAAALDVFRSMPVRTTVTWNSVLAGYSKKRGNLKEARELFDKIPQPDVVSYNTMLSCYVNNGEMGLARGFFDGMPVRDSASWNTMISGFVRSRKMDKARGMFSRMPDKNAVSWNAVISGYVECGDVDSAADLFEAAPVKNVVAWTAMINGYMKVGNVELAEKLFLEMPQKNVVTWNAMIAGYVQNCRSEDGVKLFRTMLGEGIGPNPSSLTSVLLGCSELSALSLGRQVHQLVSKSPLCHDTMAGTSLVSMYCKCGNMEDAWRLFLEIPRKDVVSWNAIISGYAQHGAGAKALSLFDEMMEQKVRPDSITFVAVILACNHAGLVDLGRKYFCSMVSDYGVQMKREHYTCMVDLLGRAGKLKEAVDLIKEMPYKPYPALFGTLLGACRIHKNVEMAEFAAENLLKLDPGSTTAFVQLANVYATVGNWDQVARVRKSMKNSEVVKTPGYSWMEIGSVVHEFRSGDTIHPELPSIHNKLNELEPKMKLAGYVPDLEFALHDVGEEQKRQLLLHHSEKLAVAYGLLKLPRRTTIQVFKNLRICGDCHVAMKHISAIERREIMIRDTTRFHRFKDGACSCGDFW